MIKSVLVILMFTLLVTSCQTHQDHCANEKALLTIANSFPSVILDFSKTKGELENKIRSITSAQNQKKPLHFNLLLNGKNYHSSIHAGHSIKPACYGMPAMQHRSPQLEVNLNFPNQALMEGKHLIPLDSIPGYIRWYLPNDKPYGEKVVKLTWKPESDALAIEKTIAQIGKGYLSFYEKEARAKFKKPLCQLDSTELNVVSKKYPFELRLWVGDPAILKIPVVKDTTLVET